MPTTIRRSVLFVTKTREFGGAEKHLLELIHGLAECGTDISILCLEEDFYSKHLKPVEAHILTRQNELRTYGEWLQLFRTIRPDVVVFVRAVLWTYDWYIPLAAYLAGIPRRVSIAHLLPPAAPANSGQASILEWFRRTRHLLPWRVSALFENAIVCVSNEIRARLLQDYRFPKRKTITIHNGVRLNKSDHHEEKSLEIRSRLGVEPQELFLVCVARLSEQKRIDILLSAVARVLQRGIRCKCVILGDGPLREALCRQSRDLGLAGQVFFEGFREDVQPYLRAAGAFVLTSSREGLPLSILEAMACGLPCVVTKVGGNSEIVRHGVDGLLVSPGSIEQVADAIVYLATHPQVRADMSVMARRRVQEDFDLENQMARMRGVILSESQGAM